MVAAPVPAPALALVPDGDNWDPADPSSPRRLVCQSPRRQLGMSSPRRGEGLAAGGAGADGDEGIVLAADASEAAGAGQGVGGDLGCAGASLVGVAGV